MKKYLPLFLLIASFAANGQTINFADNDLRIYLTGANASNNRAFINNVSVPIDTNSDGQIQVSEALLIDRLWIEGAVINNFSGIVAFTNLTKLDFKGTQAAAANLFGMSNLQQVQFYQNTLLTSVTLTGLTALIQVSATENPLLTSLTTPGCDNIVTFIANENALTSLNVSGKTALLNLYASDNAITNINVSGCTSLEGLVISGNQLVNLNISNLPNLASVNATDNYPLQSVNAQNCTMLQSSANVQLTFSGFVQTMDFSGCTAMQTFTLDNLALETLNLSNCSALTSITAHSGALANLNLSGCSALETIAVNGNMLTAIDFSDAPLLQEAYLQDNQIANFILPDYTNLATLQLDGNAELANLDVSGCVNLSQLTIPLVNSLQAVNLSGCYLLTTLHIESSLLQSVNVVGCTGLTQLDIVGSETDYMPLTTLNASNMPNLNILQVLYTHLSSIDLTNTNNLLFLTLSYGDLTDVDLSGLDDLPSVNLRSNQLETLDLSGMDTIYSVLVDDNPGLTTIFMKNGHDEALNVNNTNPLLTFICQDEAYIQSTTDYIQSQSVPAGVVVNSYCTFVPGGEYNIISGTVLNDFNGNGCGIADDAPEANIRVDITDGTNTGSTFLNADGHYDFYVPAGSFTLTPNIENASFFNFSPPTANIPFADSNNNSATQNFCLSANGVHNDAEIVIAPVIPAVPGFVAIYQILIRNKGNQSLSGIYNFTYDDNILDFVSATTFPTSQSNGLLSWAYAGLLPFESRSVYVSLSVNTPMQTPAVNIGDVLFFTATVDPTLTDETALDNQFDFDQTVIGSFDPNDITCIEGSVVSPSEIGNYLHYIVNFENLGTAPAQNVVVRLEIDPAKYNMQSLQQISTSDSCYTRITGHTVEYIFQNINLAPAAGEPPVGGHGNVLFKIKTMPTLEENDVVMNQAHIYFDYNFPILTNEAESVFQTLSSGDFTTDETVSIHPNPAKDMVSIKSANQIESVQLFDVQGRLLETRLEDSTETRLDISGRASGMYFIRIATAAGSAVKKLSKS